MRICLLANAASPHAHRWATAFADRGHEVVLLSIRSAELPGVDVRTVRFGFAGGRHRAPKGGAGEGLADDPGGNLGAGPSRGLQGSFDEGAGAGALSGAGGATLPNLAAYLRLAAGLRRRVAKIQPDVVHAHFTVTHGAMAAAARLRPLVVTAWGSDVIDLSGPLGPVRRRLNRLALARADVATATSAFLADRLRGLGPDGAAPVVHLPWGVDTGRFRPAPPRPAGDAQAAAGPVIGFVKTLHPKYGPQHLLEAMPRVLERLPAARLVLAGRGPSARSLLTRAAELGITDRVELAGFVPHLLVPRLLAGFDLLVNPTVVDESFGMAPLEAAACGLPVVATRVGGVPEVVADGETGLLVPPGDTAALAAAIVRLGSDPALARKMGQAGRRRVERELEWGRSVDRMLEVLERAAAGGAA